MVKRLEEITTEPLTQHGAIRLDVKFGEAYTSANKLYLAVLLPIQCSASNFIERMRNALDDLEKRI